MQLSSLAEITHACHSSTSQIEHNNSHVGFGQGRGVWLRGRRADVRVGPGEQSRRRHRRRTVRNHPVDLPDRQDDRVRIHSGGADGEGRVEVRERDRSAAVQVVAGH